MNTHHANLAIFILLLGIMTLSPTNGGFAVDHADLGKILRFLPSASSPELYGTIVMRTRSRKAGMPPAIFSHWSHRAKYSCNVCHQELEFVMRSGGTGITREKYLAGNYCGACHNGVIAFSGKDELPRHCDRCHLKNSNSLNEHFKQFSVNLPKAQYGNRIDWTAAIAAGKVKPAYRLTTKEGPETPVGLKKPLILGTDPRNIVTFSHETHNELDCSNCHPEIFNIKTKGTIHFSMDKNLYGMYCGACHMQVAFPMNDCHRCHPNLSNSGGY